MRLPESWAVSPIPDMNTIDNAPSYDEGLHDASRIARLTDGGDEAMSKHLRELALAATSGAWIHRWEQDGDEDGPMPDGVPTKWWSTNEAADEDVWFEADSHQDAAYIAAASPDVVLGLLDRLAAVEAERDRLAAAVERVEAIHRPIRVYDECEHDADHGCEPIEVYDYMGCSESVIGWGCSVCCYDDEYPREDCPHGADHRGIAEADSCPTRAALPDAGKGK